MQRGTQKATLIVLDDWLGFIRYNVQTQMQSNDRHNYVFTERYTTTCQTYVQIKNQLLFFSTNSLSLKHCDLTLPLIHTSCLLQS